MIVIHVIVTCFGALIFAMPILFPIDDFVEYHPRNPLK